MKFNDQMCLMTFVGRITEQKGNYNKVKGVQLILEALYYILPENLERL